MSKTFLRPKVSSTKVTDWIDPSFNDFLEYRDISTITATSLGVNNSSHREKMSMNLAVHEKKIEEVETWQPKQDGSILLITGPPGCGKTMTKKTLSKENGIQVQEWINPVLPDFQKDDFKGMFHTESSFHMFPYQSQIAVCKEFLLRATKYNKLQMLGDHLRTDKKIILVEDLPNQKYVKIGRYPFICIISDSLSGENNQSFLFPKEIREEHSTSNIITYAHMHMMKFLNRIVTIEANKNGGKITVPDKTSLEVLCQGCSGDMRSAINSLQISSSKGEDNLWPRKKRMSLKSNATLSKSKRRKKTDRVFESQEVQATGGKDVSLFLFRALGKILYSKREVVEMSHMPGDLFNLYLHQNYIDFFMETDDIVRASILSGDWNTRSLLRKYRTSIATRGVIHSNKAGGYWFLIHKKYGENCLAAKALFPDFCLPALCLQTQLLPYLALLTIPMRNQAQISLIQDIGRLPLKQHFGRLKMEALTDREHGMIDPDSGDEAQLNGGHSADESLGEPAQDTELETWSLPLSQNSASELPASQPQLFSAQGDVEENIIIEDYESDGT
uniref:RAD17 checkpoint clamp loader component n=1 Tax=Pan paniscus TaxID=9597 RepID=A0A2R9BNS5_PANPA